MKKTITEWRERMIDIVQKVGKGHLGTSLSSLEIILTIRSVMREGDIFLSSKGHDALAQYVALVEAGILDDTDLDTFRQPGGLPSHPTIKTPGIVGNTGSLGMGLSKGLGFALGTDRHVYILLGDGEMMEGQNYEAMLAIGNLNVSNITAIVDCNTFSQDGPAALRAGRIEAMFHAAGWHAFQMFLTHDDYDMQEALGVARIDGHPTAIIRHTIKGKGAEFAGTWMSHAGPPRDDYSVQHPLYRTFGHVVHAIMRKYPKVILCGADTLRDLNCYQMKNEYPDRVFDFGIAEQNIVSFASARALMGQLPIVATYACFLRRATEQIYNQVTEGTQVLYVGSMAGPLEDGGPGISHQSLDDLHWMGDMMWATQLYPSKRHQIRNWFEMAIQEKTSAYLRLIHHE